MIAMSFSMATIGSFDDGTFLQVARAERLIEHRREIFAGRAQRW